MSYSKTERFKTYRFFVNTLILSFIASYLGLAFGYPQIFTPRESDYRTFAKIAGDGWIEDGATIKLPRLLSRGTRADISLKGWRPVGVEPARLVFSVCDKEVARVIVDKPQTLRLYLTGKCQPREIKIHVENPFLAGPTDQRQLGTELLSLELSSKIGPPLVQFELPLLLTAFVFTLTILTATLFSGAMAKAASLLVLFTSSYLITTVNFGSFIQLFPPWSFAVLVAIGCHIGKKLKDAALPVFQPSSDRLNFILLLVVLFVGAFLRFGNITFGLPSNFHPDEVPKVNAIMRMVASQTLNPDYFLHPTLLLYSTYATNILLRAVGFFTGEFQDTLALSGRFVSATSGTISIFLVFLIGRLLVNARAGLIAAALLAVFPLHITCSRYLKEDAYLTFFILLSALFAALAIKRKDPRYLVLSGLFAGCSASVKYSGLLTAGIPCLAALLIESRFPKNKKTYIYLAIGLILVPIAFVACSPYTVLNHEKFIEDFMLEKNHMKKGHFFAISGWSQYWSYHLSRSLFTGINILPLALSVISIGLFLNSKSRAGWFFMLIVFAYYFPAEYVKAKPAPQPERYVVPCLPFIALLIGSGAEYVKAKYLKQSTLINLILIFAFLFPLYRSYQLYSELTPDTRDLMKEWVMENIPKGSKIYIDHKRYSPELPEDYFEITHAPRAIIHKHLVPEILKEQGQEYLIVSSLWYDRYYSQPKTEESVKYRLDKLFKTLPVVKEFKPKYGTYGFHNPRLTLYKVQ